MVALAALTSACSSDEAATDSAAESSQTVAELPVDAPPISTYELATRDHVEGTVEYPQTPPVGGDHDAVWQNCGVYREPVADENAVHSLEHGAVWITYEPGTDEAVIEELEAFADNQTHVLVTPYTGLPTPIVLTAWGVQQQLEEFDAAVVGSFVRTYEEGPQTPEPGAVCTGGLSEPA